MRRFIAYVETNNVGSRCEDIFEIDDDELGGLSEEEQANYLDEYAREVVTNMHEWGWTEVES